MGHAGWHVSLRVLLCMSGAGPVQQIADHNAKMGTLYRVSCVLRGSSRLPSAESGRGSGAQSQCVPIEGAKSKGPPRPTKQRVPKAHSWFWTLKLTVAFVAFGVLGALGHS